MTNETFKARSRRVRRIWIAVTVLVAALVVWGMLPRAADVDVAIIDTGDVRVDLVDEGRTRMHDVYTVSAPVAGRVLRVEVEPGDSVQRGAIVARMTQTAAGFLDTRGELAARALVDAASASLRAADAELQLAQRELARTQDLSQRQLVAQAVLDAAETRHAAAQAAHDSAAAELVRARSTLQPAARTGNDAIVIHAPADGNVLRVLQKSESVIAAGSPLLEIGDPGHIEIVAEFLSQDAVRMQPGQRASIENWGGEALAATVDRIEPVARMKVSALGVEEQRANVILQFSEPAAAAALGHDYRVDARVTVEEAPDALRVPLGALFRHDDGWAVYRIVEGRARLTPVGTGIADTDFRTVTEGLAAGDQVILFPSIEIHEGLRVSPRTR